MVEQGMQTTKVQILQVVKTDAPPAAALETILEVDRIFAVPVCWPRAADPRKVVRRPERVETLAPQVIPRVSWFNASGKEEAA